MNEIFVSVDVEANGPIPGPYSMYSFAAFALTQNGEVVSSFTVNLEELPGAVGHPVTMAWWKSEPEVFRACRENQQPVQESMVRFSDWLKNLGGIPVLVGYPVAYDFMFLYWYLMKYVGSSPFGHNGIDIKTYAMAVQKKTSYAESSKWTMPKHWNQNSNHTHVAIDDATGQGLLFINMMKENLVK